jgi:origin recognition complex subunit 2
MAKRKEAPTSPERDEEIADTPSKRRRRTEEPDVEIAETPQDGDHDGSNSREGLTNGVSAEQDTPSRRMRRSQLQQEEEQDEGSPTPKVNGRTLFATPSKDKNKTATATASRSVKAKADRSAQRKSARLLAEAQDGDHDDVFDEQDARLARRILKANAEPEDEDPEQREIEDENEGPDLAGQESEGEEVATPSKSTTTKRARTKTTTRKPARSPTPEGDIPPEERYFYQNRPGPVQVSTNKFNNVKLLTQDEYLEQISLQRDHHEPDKAFLMKRHARSFPQWKFEMDEGYGLCLYGYGSKRKLMTNFAHWLYSRASDDAHPRIVVVNGYTRKLNIRTILNTIASAITESEEEEEFKLTGQPEEMLDMLLSHLTSNPPPTSKLYIMVNSVDSPLMRRSQIQSILSRLSAHPRIHFLCTADTPTFAVQWTSAHLDNFRFVYHDCTTFASYDAEIPSVVDNVHDLLGRKRMRAGGKDGVGFVLKSLPENARNLYRLLLTEILTLMDNGVEELQDPDADADSDVEAEGAPSQTPRRKNSKAKQQLKGSGLTDPEDLTIAYRTLYRKASEEFICSSSMNFQFLLKEFLDHQMIFTRRDEKAGGAEVLGVPLGREEIESVLEGLI